MKNRITFILLLLYIGIEIASAQTEAVIGRYGSLHKIDGSETNEKIHSDGVMAGISFKIGLGHNWFIKPGILYGYQWYKDADIESITMDGMQLILGGNERLREHSANIPLHIGCILEIIPEILSIDMSLGPTYSFGIHSTTSVMILGSMTFRTLVDNYSGEIKNIDYPYGPDQYQYEDIITKAIEDSVPLQKRHNLSIGGHAGISIFDQIRLSIGYDVGLNDRLKSYDKAKYMRNSYCFTVSYIF